MIVNMKKYKYLIATILIIIIISTLYVMIINWKYIWGNNKIYTYFDGCMEVYKDNILVEGNCSLAKQMIEDYNKEKQWWLNNKLNISIT